MMLASCSSKDSLDIGTTPQPVTADSEIPVGFDAYTQRGITRAGASGDVSITNLKDNSTDLGKAGFGVFGYYTDNNDYDPLAIPNFMYNQQVKWDGTAFTYSPVKYWPNEYGNNAISDDADKVSFFAYAPFVEVVPSTGKITATADEAKWGITGMSRNSASGDPLIKYIVSFDQDKMVDLCWGVCDEPQWGVIQGNIQNINGGEKGKPWLDVQRPQKVDNSQLLKFQFKHALSQLNVQVDYDADSEDHNDLGTNDLADATRVYIRSISFTGLAIKGALNLNNTEAGANKAYWLDYNGTADLESGEEVTIYDGRKDGKEGASGATASNEKTLGLNPDLVQTTLWDDAAHENGVPNTAVNLFRNYNKTTNKYEAMTPTACVYVIPTGEEVTVTIVYDVETKDENLATYVSDAKTPGSSIENRITKTVNFGSANMESGMKYSLKLHLGLNSVKFDAGVEDWNDTSNNADTWLPSNKAQFVATSSAAAQIVNIKDDVTAFAIEISGLNGGETVKSTLGSEVGTNIAAAPADANANASGIATVNLTLLSNTTVYNVKNNKTVTCEGQSSHKKVVLNIVQLAKALDLAAPTTPVAGDGTITPNYGTTVADWATDLQSIKVLKNGIVLTKVDSAPTDGQYSFATGTITLGTNAASGDVYSITIQAGDAAAETITVTIP